MQIVSSGDGQLETISMESQILFSIKKKTEMYQFVVCLIRPDTGKG